MFFSIGGRVDNRFPCHHSHGNSWISMDHGWQRTAQGWFKGYSNNYCHIVTHADGIKILHSEPRSFPLWYGQDMVTNLPNDKVKQNVWADDEVVVGGNGLITINKKPMDLSVPDQALSISQALQLIRSELDTAAHALGKYNLSCIKLYCSGGVDTFLLYALLRYHDIDFELVQDEHYEWDDFTLINNDALQSFWSYQQIHHWQEPAWLATGSCGDEYLLRGPSSIAMLTAWHDINFGQLLDANVSAYHYHYFNRYRELWNSTWKDRAKLQADMPTLADLTATVLNNLVNDHQYWHLNRTITWTPFKNIQIVKNLLQCDIADLIPQFLNADLTKQLIQYYQPEIAEFVSDYKNHDCQQHMQRFYAWHSKN